HGHPVEMHLDAVANNQKVNQGLWSEIETLANGESELALIQTAKSARDAWRNKLNDIIGKVRSGSFSPEVMQEFLVAGRTEGDQYLKTLLALQDHQAERAQFEATEATARVDTALLLFTIVVLLGA